MYKPHRGLTAIAIGVGCVAVAFLLVFGVYGWYFRSPPNTETLDGVNLTIRYVGGSPPIFGPAQQDACRQTPIATPGGLLGPDCPTNLTGGRQYRFAIFELAVPSNVSVAFLNMTLASPVPFYQSLCGATGLPLRAGEFSSLSQELPNGTACSWTVVLEPPSPAPQFSGGFWMTANLSAHVVE